MILMMMRMLLLVSEEGQGHVVGKAASRELPAVVKDGGGRVGRQRRGRREGRVVRRRRGRRQILGAGGGGGVRKRRRSQGTPPCRGQWLRNFVAVVVAFVGVVLMEWRSAAVVSVVPPVHACPSGAWRGHLLLTVGLIGFDFVQRRLPDDPRQNLFNGPPLSTMVEGGS
jgi:hypothetical protein